MTQLPRKGLWIFLLEVREKGLIGEMLQAGRVVGHDVRFPWDVRDHVTVTVGALVLAGVVAQPGSGPVRRQGSLS